MGTAALLEVSREVAVRVRTSLDDLDNWGLAGTRSGQYRSDLVADDVAVSVLLDAGLGVLSEESGLHRADRELLAVVDPLDGSTNAARSIPWFATSICILDGVGPLVALVVNQATGTAWSAIRGEGARQDDIPIVASEVTALSEAVIGLSGLPPRHLGWWQYRALGAVALDLCAVASGVLDGYVDCVNTPHGGSWDYLGGVLVCREAGAVVSDVQGRDLVVRDGSTWRSPVAAGTPVLHGALCEAMRRAE